MAGQGLIGTSPVRSDAWEKVSGRCLYVGDLPAAGLWTGRVVRSTVARGCLRSIARDPAFDWSQVAFLTAGDLPGPNAVAMIREDLPILAAERIQYIGEPVALVAAPDPDRAARALEAVRLEVDELEPLLSIEDALRPAAVIWGADNLLAEQLVERGDLERGFAQAELVLEETYRTGYQEHLYLETNGVIARPRPGGGVEILGSLQCPYYVHSALSHGLGLAPEQVVVKQTVTGGAFGGKEDYPSVLAMHAALLALACGHPVRIILERSEDIRSTTKRHPSRTRHRTGVRRDGTIVAADIDLVLDGGAYTTLSPVVLSRGILHAGGAYRIPNIRIRGRAVATNTPPNGAFRGFGAPQSLFAIERQIDRIAAELRLDPLAVRRKNLLRNGDCLPCGQRLEKGVAAAEVLERAVLLSGCADPARRAPADPSPARPAAAGERAGPRPRWRRGVGLALGLHGGGFTGAGEERIRGEARVRLSREGRLDLLVSNVEMGQGASTVLCMIAAQTLGFDPADVHHPLPDTSVVPDSGPTVASRTTMIVGGILIDACRDLVRVVCDRVAEFEGVARAEVSADAAGVTVRGVRLGTFAEVARRLAASAGALTGSAAYRSPPGVPWDEERYRGDAYKAYSWIANVVELRVDVDTCEVRPERVTSVVEIGRAIHPVLAVGQVEGGVLQALAWGYLEEIKLDRQGHPGRYRNDRMTTYIIPTSLDAPEMRVEILELPYERGPFGAKGLGELPMDVGAAALAGAIDQATNTFHRRIPITPERIFQLRDKAAGGNAKGPAGGGR